MMSCHCVNTKELGEEWQSLFGSVCVCVCALPDGSANPQVLLIKTFQISEISCNCDTFFLIKVLFNLSQI